MMSVKIQLKPVYYDHKLNDKVKDTFRSALLANLDSFKYISLLMWAK